MADATVTENKRYLSFLITNKKTPLKVICIFFIVHDVINLDCNFKDKNMTVYFWPFYFYCYEKLFPPELRARLKPCRFYYSDVKNDMIYFILFLWKYLYLI